MKIERKWIGGAEMEYAVFGNGPKPLVILPGISAQFVREYAQAVEGAFRSGADAYTFYLIDRRLDPPPVYSIAQMAEDTAALLKDIGLQDVSLFGASQGGMIAMLLAARCPELIRRLLLASTAAYVDDHAAGVFRNWVALGKAGNAVTFFDRFCRDIFAPETLRKLGDTIPSLAETLSREGLERFVILAESLPGFDCRDEVGKISCPALMIESDGDSIFDPQSRASLTAIPGCRSFSYGPEFGHAVFDEAPDFRQHIFEFFG